MVHILLSKPLVLGFFGLSAAQITYNETTDAYTCSTASGAYCGGSSLSTNIIIHCTNFVGQSTNCNANLAGINPVGVKSAATCYQSSSMSGDAVCSFNGVGYPENGTTAAFPICNASSVLSLPSHNATSPSTAFRIGPSTTSSSFSSSTDSTLSAPDVPVTPSSTRTITTTVANTASGTSASTNGHTTTSEPSQVMSAPAPHNFAMPSGLLPILAVAAALVG